MKWTLEVVVVPVSDVARSKAFYEDVLGFGVDHDTDLGEGRRMVQLTPPGSGCSVVISSFLSDMVPGSLKGVQLVVNDVHAARDALVTRGFDPGPVVVVGATGVRPATTEDDLNNQGFLFFDDPDGNSWAVQQITARP
ncbi:VOC family protein [Actinokineospora guangxiensis]|uniref:VOC family protein n=1 Tax=Actinokineospora guangxiensis TaxID=1490288 RepID=A0ABW0ER28_9PSEU